MVSCTECRAAKVKCEQIFPCQRCIDKGKKCIPHESRQGQNPNRKRRNHKKRKIDDDAREMTCVDIQTVNLAQSDESPNQQPTASTAAAASGHAIIANTIANNQDKSMNHYGLHCLIRKWIALAIRRRSFRLWARVGSLADKCGFSMDAILCDFPTNDEDENDQGHDNYSPNGRVLTRDYTTRRRGMDFLQQCLTVPKQNQKVLGKPLTIDDIPPSLWKSMALMRTDDDEGDDDNNDKNNEHTNHNTAGAINSRDRLQDQLQQRWILIRQVYKGVSRYYASPAFQRHLVSQHVIEETYRADQKEVAQLFMANANSKRGFMRAHAEQVAIQYKPGMTTRPSRIQKVQLMVNDLNAVPLQENATADTITGEVSTDNPPNRKKVIEADQLVCILLPSLDRFIQITELIPLETENGGDCRSEKQQITTTATTTEANTTTKEKNTHSNSESDQGENAADSAVGMETSWNDNLFLDSMQYGEEVEDLKMIFDLLNESY